jgi:alpha-ketoglutarate-dependent 2,4-dichlorophenoxyacetate dioxygenase
MALEIKQMHQHFVGEVSGVDLTTALTPDEAAAIEAGMDRYGVLIFHGQNISDEQQIAFSKNFGDLELPDSKSNITKAHERRVRPEIADVSNLDKDNQPFDRMDRRRFFGFGNQLWHSDSSFRVIPSKFSLLSARSVVNRGGDTLFADMRAAYDALEDWQKEEVDGLICQHSLMYSRGTLGFDDLTEDELANFKPVRQSLVRVHPVTGRKSLYLSAHAGAVVGWPMPEARSLLRDLNEHATRDEFVYTHKWQLHDLVMWDNRQTMHRVRRFPNDTTEKRDMRRTTLTSGMQTAAQEDQLQAAE